MKKLFFILLSLSFSLFAIAQDNKVDMADKLREDGKIYIVVIVIGIIFSGLLIYLFSLDKKITKLEKEVKVKA